MDPDAKAAYYLDEKLKENTLKIKLDYYYNMMQKKNVSEFEKIYDTELIVRLGEKLCEEMTEDMKDTNISLLKLMKKSDQMSLDDPKAHEEELEELKKNTDLMKLGAFNEQKRIDDALAAFENNEEKALDFC